MFFEVPEWGVTMFPEKKKHEEGQRRIKKPEVDRKMSKKGAGRSKRKVTFKNENEVQIFAKGSPTLSLCKSSPKHLAPASALRSKLSSKLDGARFRYLNEKLYCSSSSEAMSYFQTCPSDFEKYHLGFCQQIQHWPVNPLDVFIHALSAEQQKDLVVADVGCGEGRLAQTLRQLQPSLKVYSYDLYAMHDHITVASMTSLPCSSSFFDLAIYCLSLMNTDHVDALKEASRILKLRGMLWIADVESRFNGQLPLFVKELEKIGFKLVDQVKCGFCDW